MPSALFHIALERFDAANREDPHTQPIDGMPYPKELLYAERMTAWLIRLAPDAPEALQLAVRCQHIRRWTIPRSDFPMDRAGYRTWRTTLAQFHASVAGAILRETGYDDATVQRVQSLVRKERIKVDPEAQTLEDVACLVFLEHYCAEFAMKHKEEKLLDILGKTWRKMSPEGRDAAKAIDFSPSVRRLIDRI